MSCLRIEQVDRVRRLVLSSPATRNMLDAALAAEILEQVDAANADSITRVVLIEAEGQVFCAGSSAEQPPNDDIFHFSGRMVKPVVAAVKGVALSAGLALMANAHVVVAAQGSSFAWTETREGRWNEAAFRALANAIGQRRARELALTGRVFSVQEALTFGLVHSVAPAFEIDDRGIEIASGLAAAEPAAIESILRAGHV